MKLKTALLCLSFTFAAPSFATGIPVVDVAGIAQFAAEATTRAKDFATSLVEAKKRLTEMKEQGEHYKNMVEGHTDFEDILYDKNLNEYFALDDWQTIYENIDDIADLRKKFDLYSDDPFMQRHYDQQLKQYKMQTMFYESSVQHNKNMNKLMTQYQSANTPSKKADLANAIAFEKTRIENDAQMQQKLQASMEQQRIFELRAKARETRRMLFEEGIPRD
ncbi:type IV secretion system protein [Vibrio harveyi]|uniref:type IV secretion system protein n=1 Tax=Vibrio harveyi TaxID=669 RepID=UPI003CEEBDC5